MATLAIHDKKWDVYFHAGEEYADRTQFISGTPTVLIPNEGYGAIGFNNAGCWTETGPGAGGYAPGSLSNCSGNIKDVIEGTAGLWYSFFSGPYGTLKLGLQYSYVKLNTWTGRGRHWCVRIEYEPDLHSERQRKYGVHFAPLLHPVTSAYRRGGAFLASPQLFPFSDHPIL